MVVGREVIIGGSRVGIDVVVLRQGRKHGETVVELHLSRCYEEATVSAAGQSKSTF